MEIEKKYLVTDIPIDYKTYPCRLLEQGYISTDPVIRIRRTDDRYILTVKSKGLLAREEFELDMEQSSYQALLKKIDGNLVSKRRYLIPLSETEGSTGNPELDRQLTIELDIFEGIFGGLIYAEVEFPSEETANAFIPPAWFDRDVTYDAAFHNSSLSAMTEREREQFIKNLR